MARRPTQTPLHRTAVAVAALGAIASLPHLAWAQAEPVKKEAATADNQVTVVEVTAQGRKQEVLQVPISIQLIGPEQIAKLGSVNIAEVSAFVPGLQIDATEPTQPNFTLRGLGTADFGIGTDSPVGVYVNGVYTGKTGGAMLNFNDIKRVEVLKGPQGTLFGRNSAGGAISVVTNDPTGSFAASGLLRMGNHATVHTEAMVNQPLGDDWAVRFSSVTQRREGWTTNATTARRAPQDNAWGARLALGWHPGGATSAVLSWEHEDLDQRPRPVWALSPVTPITAVDNEGHLDTSLFVDPRKQPLHNDVVNGRENRLFDGLTLRVEHDLGFAAFSSLTAWRQFKTENLQDNDGTDNIASHLSTGNFERNKSWQQEFRLAGNNPMVDWLVGLSLSGEDAKQTSQINTYTNSIDTLAAPPAYGELPSQGPYASMNQLALFAGFPDIDLLGQTWQENMHNTGDFKAQALFGDAIWHLGADTNLTTGIRFTRDEKKFSWHNPLHSSPGLVPQLALFTDDFFAQMVAAGVITQEQSDGLQAVVDLSQFGNLEFDNTQWMAAPVYAKKSWTNVSPRLVIDHHFGKDTMVFGSVTRGYQAGGFNSVSTDVQGGSFGPETVTNYEIGIKGRLANSGLSYGASLFHYLFKNLQSINLFHPQDGSIPYYGITVSDVQATGADLEAQWQLSKEFRLFGSAELIDQTYKAQRNRPEGSNDLTGQPYGTPTTSLTAGFDVQWALGGGNLNWSLQGSYLGATRCNDDSEMQGACLKAPGFRVGEARQRVDTRLGWEADTRQWGVALIVNNLFDKQYVQFLSNLSAPVGSPYYAGLSEPRHIQLEVKVKL
ncbi:MAG TPA: TonB-dependent receptor [Ideonella sp.]|uniref:TonB-dependent receptor n=1 Tax=Ideonella sp. TaxID=1929293 RepID=UPI002E2EB0CD|nr:TonB-dependent receptor [Ideonella sp.]HEX5685365.1 TonB-dependent receptor [Ideonella sp.]